LAILPLRILEISIEISRLERQPRTARTQCKELLSDELQAFLQNVTIDFGAAGAHFAFRVMRS
jgi:hypothetical protein